MKAIICELCGSNELVKEGGIFRCLHCGTKYTAEEARSLITEIAGTVRIDRSDDMNRLLANANARFSDRNYAEAVALYSQVLNIQPDNPTAILYKALSSAYMSAPGYLNATELSNSFARAFPALHRKYAADNQLADFFMFCVGYCRSFAAFVDCETFKRSNETAIIAQRRQLASSGHALFSYLLRNGLQYDYATNEFWSALNMVMEKLSIMTSRGEFRSESWSLDNYYEEWIARSLKASGHFNAYAQSRRRLEKIQDRLYDKRHELALLKANILRDPQELQRLRKEIRALEGQERKEEQKIQRLLDAR